MAKRLRISDHHKLISNHQFINNKIAIITRAMNTSFIESPSVHTFGIDVSSGKFYTHSTMGVGIHDPYWPNFIPHLLAQIFAST